MKFLHYINSNYERQITLDDIANSGNISRSECCRFFKKTIHFAVGFNSINYYITTFKKQMGCSPREYRKKCLELLEKAEL